VMAGCPLFGYFFGASKKSNLPRTRKETSNKEPPIIKSKLDCIELKE